MLSNNDIDWIKGNRSEITQNRTFNVTFIGETEAGEHPITGEPIDGEPVTETTQAVVTEITSAFKMDRDLINGVEVEEGDVWIDVDLRDLSVLDAKRVKSANYSNENYTILAADNVGLGGPNRITMVGRLTG